MKRKTTKEKSKGAVAIASASLTPSGRTRKATPKLYAVTRTAPADPSVGVVAPKAVRSQQFGRALVAALLEKGLKQIQLSEITGIGRDSISGYCNGHNIPGNDRLKLIADALGLRPDQLVTTAGAEYRSVEGNPPFFIRQGTGEDIWLTINRPITFKTASAVMEMVKDDLAKRKKPKGS